jgi:hypothetical protein
MSDGNYASRAAGHEPLRVERTTDYRDSELFVVYDEGGIAEVSSEVRGLSPLARMVWARQQGLAPDVVARAGEADGILYRGIRD